MHVIIKIFIISDCAQARPSLQQVYRLLKTKCCRWDAIGRELAVPLSYRDELRQEGLTTSNESKLERLLNHWLETECSEVSWDHLIKVLQELQWNDSLREVHKFLEDV